MLKIRNVHKSFDDRKILNGLNFELKAGKIYSLMGANGTGKTTLFNILTGFLSTDAGIIYFEKKNITNCLPIKINHLGITRTFQNLRLIEGLSVKENILLSFKENRGENIFNAMLPDFLFKEHYKSFDERAEKIIEQIFLNDVAESKAGEISYGQQKLLTLGCCLANDAELLLLDEPVAGINPDYREKIVALLKDIKNDGKTILLIEHNADFISDVSDKIFFLSNGIISNFQSYDELKSDSIVQEAYL
jgi:branched-chain amino acid transport system ATP-binding protein